MIENIVYKKGSREKRESRSDRERSGAEGEFNSEFGIRNSEFRILPTPHTPHPIYCSLLPAPFIKSIAISGVATMNLLRFPV
ncbi:MAG: hypothetical protein N4J56_003376 [Chroococcidiopsis sp. SAG 2025]|nr:hypothetical protein [Chroococcidiopsis sp. SAG 2025]